MRQHAAKQLAVRARTASFHAAWTEYHEVHGAMKLDFEISDLRKLICRRSQSLQVLRGKLPSEPGRPSYHHEFKIPRYRCAGIDGSGRALSFEVESAPQQSPAYASAVK
jgi:hypothetical protein